MSTPNCDLSFDPRDPYLPLPAGIGGTAWTIQVFTDRNGYGLDASRLTTAASDDGWTYRFGGYARLGQQRMVDAGEVVVVIRRTGGEWVFDVSATHLEEIKAIKLAFRGLPEPETGARWSSPTTPVGEVGSAPTFQWNYPGQEWATKWATNGRAIIGMRDPSVSAAALHISSPPYATGSVTELVHVVPASTRGRAARVPPIHLELDAGDPARVERSLGAHLSFVESAFGLETWETRPDVPDWARSVSTVVSLHGQHWTGHVFNTFDDMIRILDRIAEVAEPAEVLAYLPGWEGRYYFDYPRYAPSEDLGGEDGFHRLVRHAHDLGVRVMPMFGANGANAQQYTRWQDAALRNPTDRYPVALNAPDWDGDRFPETDQVFLNPGEPGFRALLVEAILRVADLGVDAVFLDTAGFWFDDPRFPLYDGYRALRAEVRAAHPELLLVSEGWWDAMIALFPMSQQWLGVPRDVMWPELLTRYARTTGHLAETNDASSSTGVHEEGFRPPSRSASFPGHIPSVSFVDGDIDRQLAVIRAIAERNAKAADR
jgi:hypothetical protein